MNILLFHMPSIHFNHGQAGHGPSFRPYLIPMTCPPRSDQAPVGPRDPCPSHCPGPHEHATFEISRPPLPRRAREGSGRLAQQGSPVGVWVFTTKHVAHVGSRSRPKRRTSPLVATPRHTGRAEGTSRRAIVSLPRSAAKWSAEVPSGKLLCRSKPMVSNP